MRYVLWLVLFEQWLFGNYWRLSELWIGLSTAHAADLEFALRYELCFKNFENFEKWNTAEGEGCKSLLIITQFSIQNKRSCIYYVNSNKLSWISS